MSGMNPSGLSLVWPMLAQIVLTFVILGVMFSRRFKAMKAREVRMADIALSQDRWPDAPRQASNNFTNQFESPVLFYALVLLAIHVGATGIVMTVLAWVYVASRIGHAYIHLGSNKVSLRAQVYAIGMGALALMTIGVAITIAF